MEISRVIKGKKESFFDVLVLSLQQDIKQVLGKDIKIEDITSGYTYQKRLKNRLGRAGDVNVTITEIDVPNKYCAEFESAQGINTLCYTLEDIDEDHFQVHYEEGFLSNKAGRNLNYTMMSKLYKKSSIKRANLLLDQIEAYMKK